MSVRDGQSMGQYDAGMAVRRAVLGDVYVDRSLANTTDFNAPMQRLVTEYCWGAVWTRTELDRRTRSLVNLSMLTALGKSHELSLHVRGAVNNGCTREEIREVFLQTAIYCGVPAALEGYRVASDVLSAIDAEA